MVLWACVHSIISRFQVSKNISANRNDEIYHIHEMNLLTFLEGKSGWIIVPCPTRILPVEGEITCRI